uniref:Uncharacterized protein LOC114348845 n=1 Tax=Diabrotica virgifera virgifera TaxID=50390 RepID=A0A6P7H0L1_DIAVI
FDGSSRYVNCIPDDGDLSEDDVGSDLDHDYIPDNKELSEDELGSDSDDEYIPPSRHSQCDDSDSNEQSNLDENLPSCSGVTELPECTLELETPADFFLFLFPKELISMIVEQSNIKALQDNINKPANISENEMEQFIGTVIFMSLVKLPSSRLYWSATVGQPQVFESMTCNRWEIIKKNLHFSDNSNSVPKNLHFSDNSNSVPVGTPGHDKRFKIRPLLDNIKQRLLLVPKEEHLAVDEQIIPTKCRHHLKQYNPAKPHKWGYKNQVLSGVSGFSYDFDIFAGEQSNTFPNGAPDLG